MLKISPVSECLHCRHVTGGQRGYASVPPGGRFGLAAVSRDEGKENPGRVTRRESRTTESQDPAGSRWQAEREAPPPPPL